MTTEAVLTKTQIAAFDTLARSLVDDFGVAGLALAVVCNEQVLARGYGVKNCVSGEPVDANTLFHLASISKTFVATAVMQLLNKFCNALVDLLLGMEADTPKPPALLTLGAVLADEGAPAAAKRYRQLETASSGRYRFDADQFEEYAEALQETGQIAASQRIARLGLGLYPDAEALVGLAGNVDEIPMPPG